MLELTTIYALGDDGLTVTTALNVGEGDAPYGYGAHPYLSIADTPVAEVALEIPQPPISRPTPNGSARRDPSGRGVGLRLRGSRPIGDLSLDTAFTDLCARRRRPVDGHPHRPRRRRGEPLGRRGVRVDAGLHGPRPSAYRGDDRHRRRADDLPADAFNSGTDLVVLRPEQSHTGSWGIRPA